MPHRLIIAKLIELADELAPNNPKVKALLLEIAGYVADVAEDQHQQATDLEARLVENTASNVKELRELIVQKVFNLSGQVERGQQETRDKLHSLANYLQGVEFKISELAELLTADEANTSE